MVSYLWISDWWLDSLLYQNVYFFWVFRQNNHFWKDKDITEANYKTIMFYKQHNSVSNLKNCNNSHINLQGHIDGKHTQLAAPKIYHIFDWIFSVFPSFHFNFPLRFHFHCLNSPRNYCPLYHRSYKKSVFFLFLF